MSRLFLQAGTKSILPLRLNPLSFQRTNVFLFLYGGKKVILNMCCFYVIFIEVKQSELRTASISKHFPLHLRLITNKPKTLMWIDVIFIRSVVSGTKHVLLLDHPVWAWRTVVADLQRIKVILAVFYPVLGNVHAVSQPYWQLFWTTIRFTLSRFSHLLLSLCVVQKVDIFRNFTVSDECSKNFTIIKFNLTLSQAIINKNTKKKARDVFSQLNRKELCVVV